MLKKKQYFLNERSAQFQVTIHAMMIMSDIQRYPLNLYLINNVEDILSF